MSCETILLVEDDDDIRSTLKEVLELEGYSVATAAHGQEAFERLEEIERPCIILLDLMMPVMNGWEFLEKQKVHKKFSSIPVLVVSAAGEKARSASAAQGFVKKPIEVDGLLELIKKYCNKPST